MIEPLAEGGFVAKRLVLVVILALVVPATSLAATVKVRVEGKSQTLFGPTEITVTASNALDALEQASIIGEIYYHVTPTSFGPFVDQVGRYGGSGSSGWVFKVNDLSPPVGADKVTLADGDRVLWYYADFGPTGGPPTLTVKAAAKAGCYTAAALDDNAKATTVAGLTWHVGSKKTAAGTTGTAYCPGKHAGLLVRATATNAVRSNVVKGDISPSCCSRSSSPVAARKSAGTGRRNSGSPATAAPASSSPALCPQATTASAPSSGS
jgi:Domain of unknown function (DUF4430)